MDFSKGFNLQLATLFGLGKIPGGGTWASLFVLLIAMYEQNVEIVSFLSFLSLIVGPIAYRKLVNESISEDPKEYVLDEVIGMGIALSGVYIFYNSIERIEFNTNGVLTNRWLSSVVQLKMGTRLAEADISIIKAQLEAVGQVHFASVERVFPDALRIDIKEYLPINFIYFFQIYSFLFIFSLFSLFLFSLLILHLILQLVLLVTLHHLLLLLVKLFLMARFNL